MALEDSRKIGINHIPTTTNMTHIIIIEAGITIIIGIVGVIKMEEVTINALQVKGVLDMLTATLAVVNIINNELVHKAAIMMIGLLPMVALQATTTRQVPTSMAAITEATISMEDRATEPVEITTTAREDSPQIQDRAIDILIQKISPWIPLSRHQIGLSWN